MVFVSIYKECRMILGIIGSRVNRESYCVIIDKVRSLAMW